MEYDDENENEESPIPPEKLDKLLRDLELATQKLGMHMRTCSLTVDEDESAHLLGLFQVSPAAFSRRVLDPEADKEAVEFKVLEQSFIEQQIDEIRNRYGTSGEEDKS